MIAESARYKAMLDRDAAICTEMETLLATVDADTGEMSDDATAKFEALEAEGTKLTASLGRETILRDRRRNLTPQPDGNTLAQQRADKVTRDADDDGVAVGKTLLDNDPNHGFGAGVRGERNFILGVMHEGQHGYESAVAKWPGLRKFRAPSGFQATVGSDEHSTFDDSRGGFFIPTTIVGGVLTIDQELDPISALVTPLPMQTPTVVMNALVDKNHSSSVSGGFTVARGEESGTFSSSRQRYEQITWHVNELHGFAYATETLINDSPISIAAMIQQGFAREFPSQIMTERFNGTGAGQFLGLLNLPSNLLITVAAETGGGGQVLKTIVAENVIKMRSRCYGYNKAVWILNHDCMPQMPGLAVTVGTTAISLYHTSLLNDVPDTLLGRPVFYNDNPKTLGTKGDIWCVNWSEYWEGTYQPLQQAESIHFRFDTNERTFRFLLRNDGRPAWKIALTPKVSSITRSPFVTLATRA